MKKKRDRGDSTLVSAVLILPLILGILITMIDVSIYFSDRGQILNVTRDASRQVAIFGGDGTNNVATSLQYTYGVSRSSVCTTALANSDMVKKAYNSSTSSAVECSLMQSLKGTNGLVGIEITGVQCGVANSSGEFTGSKATAIGQQVGCKVTWNYSSVPGSGLSYMMMAKNSSRGDIYNQQVTKVNATSEVNLNRICMVSWTNGSCSV